MNETATLSLHSTSKAINEKKRISDTLLNPEAEVIMKGESSESTDSERNSKKRATIENFPTDEKDIRKPLKAKKNLPKVIMNVEGTKYPVVRYVGKKVFGWKLTTDIEADWDLYWTDCAVQVDQLGRMKPYQKINHFPGMFSLAQKNHLGRNLMRLKKTFSDNYDFFPPTWNLPAEMVDFRNQFKNKKSNKTYIIKPAASCQGRGIYLTRTWENIVANESTVAQRYITQPYLIDGLKFDLRIYVLLAGCDPLRIYMYEEGLARFATEPYVTPKSDNIENMCMHLTNYAINKENPNFVFNTNEKDADMGHKRSMTSVFKLLQEQGHDVEKLKNQIKKMIVKTFCAVQPVLAHNYRSCQPDEPYNNMCFEVLGFDVLLDHKLKPWLIEVNHTPSFSTDTPLDQQVKRSVIGDALKLMNVSAETKLKYKAKQKSNLNKMLSRGKKERQTPEERQKSIIKAQKQRDEYEMANLGGYAKLYPLGDQEPTEPYENFISESLKWFQNLTGSNVRRNTKKESKDPKDATIPFKVGKNRTGTTPPKSSDMLSKTTYGGKKSFEWSKDKSEKDSDLRKAQSKHSLGTTENNETDGVNRNEETKTDYHLENLNSTLSQDINFKVNNSIQFTKTGNLSQLHEADQFVSRNQSERQEIERSKNLNTEQRVSQEPYDLPKNSNDLRNHNTKVLPEVKLSNKNIRPSTEQASNRTQRQSSQPGTQSNSKSNLDSMKMQLSKVSQGSELPSTRANALQYQELDTYGRPGKNNLEELIQTLQYEENEPIDRADLSESPYKVSNPYEFDQITSRTRAATNYYKTEEMQGIPVENFYKFNKKARATTASSRTKTIQSNKVGGVVTSATSRETYFLKTMKGGTQENFYSTVQKGGFVQPKVMNIQMDGILKPEQVKQPRVIKLPIRLIHQAAYKPDYRERTAVNIQSAYKTSDKSNPNISMDDVMKLLQKRTSPFMIANPQHSMYSKRYNH